MNMYRVSWSFIKNMFDLNEHRLRDTKRKSQNGWFHRTLKIYGCFQKKGYPQIIHFNRVFHYKPSIFRYPYFWKHPYNQEESFCPPNNDPSNQMFCFTAHLEDRQFHIPPNGTFRKSNPREYDWLAQVIRVTSFTGKMWELLGEYPSSLFRKYSPIFLYNPYFSR